MRIGNFFREGFNFLGVGGITTISGAIDGSSNCTELQHLAKLIFIEILNHVPGRYAFVYQPGMNRTHQGITCTYSILDLDLGDLLGNVIIPCEKTATHFPCCDYDHPVFLIQQILSKLFWCQIWSHEFKILIAEFDNTGKAKQMIDFPKPFLPIINKIGPDIRINCNHNLVSQFGDQV